MKSDEKTIEYLMKRIEAKGYPLEIDVSNILAKRLSRRQKVWYVQNSVYFFDPEFSLGRTLDITAVHYTKRKLDEKLRPLSPSCNLAIECKKSSSKAWVFFTRPHTSFTHYYGQILDFVEMNSDLKDSCVNYILDQSEKPCLHYANYKNVALAYTELEFDKSKRTPKNSSLDLILKATNQLMKCISYRFQMYREIKSWTVAPLYFYFPIIVFDGKMYEYSMKSGKGNLTPVKRVLLESSYRPSFSQRELQFGIEIISKDALEEVLRDIEKDCSTIYSELIRLKEGLVSKFSQLIPK